MADGFEKSLGTSTHALDNLASECAERPANPTFGEGDTCLIHDVLGPNLSETAFGNLRQEVIWRQMFHRGGEVPRLVAVEGEIGPDGSIPIYRHPSDTLLPLHPFSPTVQLIHDAIQPLLPHPLNHVLIQHYRHGGDDISEHSDKTIDLVRGSNIVNVSLGAKRVMVLRTKKDSPYKASRDTTPDEVNNPIQESGRTIERIPLPHNSMLIMGLETNRKWLHSIRTDKRPIRNKSPEEILFGGESTSLTFRQIGTFLIREDGQMKIYGQGATSKLMDTARPIINEFEEGGAEPAEKLIIAFGGENHDRNFDWNSVYGEGSDVVNYRQESE